MVLRCKGLSHTTQDSVFKGVALEEVDSPLNSVKNKKPSQKNVSKSEAAKATSKKKANQMVNFILIIHNCSYANGVELFLKQIDGVESVKGERNSIRLEVKGKVDPLKIREMVEHKTKQKVELIFPLSEMEGNRDENKGTEATVKQIKRAHRNEIANEGLLVLKMTLCCDSCEQKLQKILKNKGLEIVSMEKEKDLVTVKGTVDVTELRSCIKHEIKKEIEIVVPTKVIIPAKKDKGTSNKTQKYAGEIKKKDKDISAAHKADKSNATINENYRDTATVGEKYRGTSIVDQKFKGTNKVDEKHKATNKVDEKDQGTTIVHEKDKGIATIDEKEKGSATKDNKDEEKDEYGHSNHEKWRDRGGEMKYKASDGGVGERGKVRDGVGNKEEDFGATIKLNPMMHYRYDDNAYGYWQEWRPVKYSNGLHQLFSDENPHSCSVM